MAKRRLNPVMTDTYILTGAHTVQSRILKCFMSGQTLCSSLYTKSSKISFNGMRELVDEKL